MLLRVFLAALLLAVATNCGGSGDSAPSPTATPPAESLTVDQLLDRARAALFDGSEVLHVTVLGERAGYLVDYSEAWIQRSSDLVRKRIQEERLVHDYARPSIELIVDGCRSAGLATEADCSIDPLHALLPIEHFTNVPATAPPARVEKEAGAVVLVRHYPEMRVHEAQCAFDIRLSLDGASYTPMRAELVNLPCSFRGDVVEGGATVDFSYGSLAAANVPPGFFDVRALRETYLRESVDRIRARRFAAYWLGGQELTTIWPQIEASPNAGVRFGYGKDGTDLMIESWPANVPISERCPLRQGSGGIVVGDIETEATITIFGPARFCPSDGWLSLEINGTQVVLWPGQQRETVQQLIEIANRLTVVS